MSQSNEKELNKKESNCYIDLSDFKKTLDKVFADYEKKYGGAERKKDAPAPETVAPTVVPDAEPDTDVEPTTKLYQIILVDPVWDNFEEYGWYDSLKDASHSLKDVVVQVLVSAAMDGAKFYLTAADNMGEVNAPEGAISIPSFWDEFFNKHVVMPDDFIAEYPSTFTYCIDRPYISIVDLIEECCPDLRLAEEDEDRYSDGEYGLSIRGFIHEVHTKDAPAILKAFTRQYY